VKGLAAELVPVAVTLGVIGLVALAVWLYSSGRDAVLYQTDELVVNRRPLVEGARSKRIQVDFIDPNPTPDDLAAIARVMDEHLLGDGEQIDRALLFRLQMRVVCMDGGAP